MVVAKIEKQQVIGALKSTSSSDPDILFARKEELLAPTRAMKMMGTFPLIMGSFMTLTIIGAVVGIPFIFFGLFVRKRIRINVENAEAALADYTASLQARAQAAGA